MTNQVRMLRVAGLLSFLQLFSQSSCAEVSGQLIAYNCYSCHGSDLSALGSRILTSQDELNQTLLAFKYNRKKATVMDRITKGYTDAELKSVAQFIKEQD